MVPGAALAARCRSSRRLKRADDVVLEGRSVGRHDRHREDDRLGAPLPDDAGDEGPVTAQTVDEPVDVVEDDAGVLRVARRLGPDADAGALEGHPSVRTRARGRVRARLGGLVRGPRRGTRGAGRGRCRARPRRDRPLSGVTVERGSGADHTTGVRPPMPGVPYSATAPPAPPHMPPAPPQMPPAHPTCHRPAPDATAAPDAATGGEDVLDADATGHAPAATVAALATLLLGVVELAVGRGQPAQAELVVEEGATLGGLHQCGLEEPPGVGQLGRLGGVAGQADAGHGDVGVRSEVLGDLAAGGQRDRLTDRLDDEGVRELGREVDELVDAGRTPVGVEVGVVHVAHEQGVADVDGRQRRRLARGQGRGVGVEHAGAEPARQERRDHGGRRDRARAVGL